MIKLEDIYAATRNGLDIILYYYPQAKDAVDSKKPFCLRGEKTASTYIKQFGNIWKITDFGDDAHAKSPIDVMMREEGLNFAECVCTLADRYGVGNTLNATINKPDFKQRPATESEPAGHFDYEAKEAFTPAELEVLGAKVEQRHVDALGYKSLAWYSLTKLNDKKVLETTTVSSNEHYPIFARICPTDKEHFVKVYQPLNTDKAYRFFYKGAKPKDYINGLDELRKTWSELNETERRIFESNKANENKAYKEQKLDAVVICSGERDAINTKSFGFCPLWLNSESATIDIWAYKEICKYAEKVYNIPDIDVTGLRKGVELGMKHLDIHTVKLPMWLSTFKDMRGKPRKDLRDFLELRSLRSDFENLLKIAMPYRFWQWVETKNGKSLEINTAYLLNFLSDAGFGKIQDPNTKKETLVQVVGSTVREVTSKDIRAYIVRFVRENVADITVLNLVLNSTRTKTVTMEDLNVIELDFKNFEDNKQYMFFANKTLEITPDGIKEHRPAESGRYVWDTAISKHRFKRLAPSFKITQSENNDEYMIDILDIKSHYFRYLINSSRMYWREELEEMETGDKEKDEAYALANKFTIDGQRLSYEQIEEQQQNLIAKIFAIGYIMHRYKAESKSWTLWVMEDKVSEDGVSSGGSGKSFMMRFLQKFVTTVTLGGRNKKLTENPHIFENVTRNTHFILVDDADQYIDFDFFYDKITGGLDINGKHVKSEPLSPEDSPKLVFTSNFPPRSGSSSTARRLLYVVFSDYYHEATEDNGYRESRAIRSDFGYDICNAKYSEDFWNEDINFLVECQQFYLSTCANNVKIQPPMKKVQERQNIATMGNQFRSWADVYFSHDGTNINIELSREQAFTDFVNDSKVKNWTTQAFTKAMKAFCKNADWVFELNPKELCNQPKRITRNISGKTTEMIYVRTNDAIGNPMDLNKTGLPDRQLTISNN